MARAVWEYVQVNFMRSIDWDGRVSDWVAQNLSDCNDKQVVGLINVLNGLGAEGWELVNLIPWGGLNRGEISGVGNSDGTLEVNFAYNVGVVTAVLKRRVKTHGHDG